MRERLRTLACRLLNLVRTETAAAYCMEAVATQREADASRCDDLADGLTFAAMGPYGQAQYQAYQWAAKVVRAEKWTPPSIVQSESLHIGR